MKTAERPTTVKQTYKASELPKRMQDALHVGPEVDITIRAEVGKGRDWAGMARQIAKEGALRGLSEDLLERGRTFRENLEFMRG